MEDPQNSVFKQNNADDLAQNVNMQDEQPEERHDTRAPDMDEDGEFNTIDEPVMTTIVSKSTSYSKSLLNCVLSFSFISITEKRS